MDTVAKFNDQWVQLVHGLIQKAPPNGVADVVFACRELCAPAKIPDELIWRSCLDHREKLITAVPLPLQHGAGMGIICETGRAGSRAQRVVGYADAKHDDKLFCVDSETGDVSSIMDKKKSGDLSAELSNLDKEAAKPFQDALDAELDGYVSQRYPTSKRGALHGCEGHSGAAVFVVIGKDPGDDIELRILLASKRVRKAGYWAGNWSSQWRVVFSPEQKDPMILGGVLEFKTHYSEDSNVHFNRKAIRKAKIQETSSPEKWAKEMVAAVKKIEDEFQQATDDVCANMGSGALKAMRRVLPMSKERFDWRPIRHSLVKDMKNAEAKDYTVPLDEDE